MNTIAIAVRASRARVPWAIALGCVFPATQPAQAAALIYGYDASEQHLVSFFSDAPGTFADDVPLTGLATSEVLAGFDFRPATGALYAVAVNGPTSRVVTIDTASGALTTVGALLSTPLGSDFGMDFNPVVDRIRFVSNDNVNQRLDPDDGTLVSTDVPLAYATGDVGEGSNPFVVHVAYTNSTHGATTTTIYGIDTGLDSLVRVGAPSPNGGLLATIGALGVNASPTGGFDIEPGTNTAFAALRVASVSSLYVIDVTTGAATLVGSIGGGGNAIAAIAVPEPGAVASALGVFALLGWLRAKKRSAPPRGA